MEISRSKWDNFIKCPLCFYLLEKHQIKPPGTPGHPINSRVDSLLKEEFDELRAKGEPHPIFKEYNLFTFSVLSLECSLECIIKIGLSMLSCISQLQ